MWKINLEIQHSDNGGNVSSTCLLGNVLVNTGATTGTDDQILAQDLVRRNTVPPRRPLPTSSRNNRVPQKYLSQNPTVPFVFAQTSFGTPSNLITRLYNSTFWNEFIT